ncbi:CvfB family protein [Bacillus solitudinis]|uniref:CvfB family protein n=1 Tax=Bacillus solitudinis TaxID=2014074 RepID=UPI000C238A0B|nr:S1-like domain-containing RNA-binding protein [Bacillus solitudinis]
MELKPGYTVTLNVARTAGFGYFLNLGEEDVLLHEREATRKLEVGESVEVFLYHDHQERLSATMEVPFLRVGEIAWLETVSVKTGHGVFLNNGVSRDLFLSMDELPYDRARWPQPGDKLPVSITWDKRGRMMAKLVKGEAIESQSKAAADIMMHKEIQGYVYHYLDEGALLLSDEGYLAFIHEDEMTQKPRFGEHVSVRVIYVRPDGRLNVTMRPLRSEQQEDDAEKIYQYLQGRGGSMPYWDKTPPEDISQRFGISKASFKRALGKLIKENKIEQRDGWTYLKEKS